MLDLKVDGLWELLGARWDDGDLRDRVKGSENLILEDPVREPAPSNRVVRTIVLCVQYVPTMGYGICSPAEHACSLLL